MTGSFRWEGISRSLQSNHLLKRSPRVTPSCSGLCLIESWNLPGWQLHILSKQRIPLADCSHRERDFPQSQCMLMVSVHLLLHLCKVVLQEDSLHAFPTEWREAEEPAVPCIALLTFMEDSYNICLSPATGAPPQSPWPLKDDRKHPRMDTKQLALGRSLFCSIDKNLDQVLSNNPWLGPYPLASCPSSALSLSTEACEASLVDTEA